MLPSHSHRITAQAAASRPFRWPQWAALGVVLLGVALTVLLITRVERQSLTDKYERIDHVMSRGEVEMLLGKPTRVDVRTEQVQGMETNVDILEWTFTDAPQRIQVELVNDKVISKKLLDVR